MLDAYNGMKVTQVIKPHSPAATGTISGVVIDTAGYRSLTFVVGAGLQTTTGITVTPVITQGSATGSLASAADADLFGTEAAVAALLAGASGASTSARIGYRGKYRYVTCDLIIAGAATGLYHVDAIQMHGSKKPES